MKLTVNVPARISQLPFLFLLFCSCSLQFHCAQNKMKPAADSKDAGENSGGGKWGKNYPVMQFRSWRLLKALSSPRNATQSAVAPCLFHISLFSRTTQRSANNNAFSTVPSEFPSISQRWNKTKNNEMQIFKLHSRQSPFFFILPP